LKQDADGTLRPRARAATFPELTSALRQYLEIVAQMQSRCRTVPGLLYRSSEELILKTTKPVWANFDDMHLEPMQPKECFHNAFALSSVDPALRYTEGFALMDGSIPTHHAWLTDPDGKALDPTWPSVYRGHAERSPGKRWSGRVVYMGIAVDADAHLRWVERTRYPNFLAVGDSDVEELLRLGTDALL